MRKIIRHRSFLPYVTFLLLGITLALAFNQIAIENEKPYWITGLIVPLASYLFFNQFKSKIRKLKESFYLGLLFGLGFFSFSLHWLIKAPLEVMNLPFWLALLMIILLIILFALSLSPFFMAVFIAFKAQSKSAKNKLNTYQRWLNHKSLYFCAYLPSIWILLEWLRSEFLYLPLLKIGHLQINTFLAQIVSLIGVYGLSFLVWLIAGISYLIVDSKLKQTFSYSIILFLLMLALWQYQKLNFLDWTKKTTGEQNFAIVQGNVAQNQKFKPLSLSTTLNRYSRFSKDYKNTIIIWPETAIAAFKNQLGNQLNQLLDQVQKNQSTLLSGIILSEFDLKDIQEITDENKYNYYTALANLADLKQNYLKTKLVIFGEYIPLLFLFKPILKAIETPFSSYSAGINQQSIIKIKQTHIASGICLEAAYGRLYARFKDNNVLVNISNDAWFDHSIALPLHLLVNRFRAIELKRFLVRSANSGISAFINPNGKIVSYLPAYQSGSIKHNTPLLKIKTAYQYFADWPILLLSLVFVGLFLGSLVKTRLS